MKPALPAVLLALAFLAGCSSPSAGTDDAPDEEGNHRQSIDSDDRHGTPTKQKIGEGAIDLVGQEEASFEVEVPEHMLSAYLRYKPATQAVQVSWFVDLGGCGRYEGATSLRNVPFEADLCEEPTPGKQTVRVGTEAGYLDGRLEVWGMVPTHNATL